jgi:hypothetical protein
MIRVNDKSSGNVWGPVSQVNTTTTTTKKGSQVGYWTGWRQQYLGTRGGGVTEGVTRDDAALASFHVPA